MTNSCTRPRQPATVPAAWVGPLVTILLLGIIAAASAGAGPDNSPAKVLDCLVTEEVPSPAATASDGGFTFHYQSLGGVTEDGRACTVYRLKNEAGGPPTPVRWLAGDDVLVDLAQLRRCRDADGCPWLEVGRYFDGEFHDGSTLLTFGLNADSFRQDSNGLIANTAPSLGETAASVGTEVVGTLTLADESEIELDLVVKSRFERRGGAAILIYEVVSDDPGLLSGERLALVWPVTTGPPGAGPTSREKRQPFLQLPARSWAALGRPSYTIVREGDSVAVEVAVSDFEYLPDSALYFVEPRDPTTILLRVPLPAFVPADP